ncbi:MAG: AarF/ABC1/UbiB kinase family protein [Deltaproteobacteria bacterium]|nr:AarF/ABC1/UbiB kinase family protein [Deltaproteobacteria bacterium]MBW2417383.1 AarF/ABC1/UbiB kinase family protein [Deltaproteobacteria bacterium]
MNQPTTPSQLAPPPADAPMGRGALEASQPPTIRAPLSLGPRSAGIRFKLRSSGVEAGLRLGVCVATIAVDHGIGALVDRFSSAASRERRREARLLRSATRLARVFGRLKGAFAKAGQLASLRIDVLPPAVRGELASLRDRVPPLPFSEIRPAVESALGRPLEEAFSSFESEPIGAASVAQVHRAELHDGRPVAVKVRYPWAARSLASDLRMLERLIGLWVRWGPGPPISPERLVEELAQSLEAELDFDNEARVAREVAANLAGDPRISVPLPIPSHSCSALLTVEYRDAISVGDRVGLRARGIDPAEVLGVLVRAYAKQIFVDGLFHADPHPGNLFVLDEPEARERPRVLFVDFGLSQRLTPDLRREMRRGIYALLQRDPAAFVARMDAMGMIAPGAEAEVRVAIEAMFARMASSGPGQSQPAVSGSQVLQLKDEAKRLLQATPGVQLPHELLLYAKTLSYLFALGAELAPEVDVLELSLPHLLRFLATRD